MGQPETSPIYMQEGQIGPCLAAAAPGAAPGMPSVGSRYAEVRTPSSAVIAAVFAGGSITTSLWPMTGRFGLGNLSRRTSGFRRSCRLSSLVIRQKAKARGLDHRLSWPLLARAYPQVWRSMCGRAFNSRPAAANWSSRTMLLYPRLEFLAARILFYELGIAA